MSEFRRRYPGTGPFGPEDAELFFGRKTETEELYLRVLSVPLLLQFGKSGLGKTSLLQAGLFPLLRAKPFLPVMIRLNDPRESLTDAVARSIVESVRDEGVDDGDVSAAGLWELLVAITAWREDLLLTPVLVFDQFEEVFTLRDQTFRDELAAELGALATGIPPERLRGAQTECPDVKLLISLKETHLGELEQFSARIPRLFQERLRLEPLSESEARDAVVEPAKLEGREGEPPYWTKPFTYDENTLDSMLTYLKGRSDVIEPFQLQLLCQHAEGIARKKESTQNEPVTLTMDDFRWGNAFGAVLENFYRDVLSRIPSPAERKRAAALCEEGLLGSSGQRLMLEEKEIFSDYGISGSTLQILGRERLVREERRMESTFHELSHDRLAESVFAARKDRLPKAVRRRLWASGMAGLLIAALLIMGVLLAWNSTVQRERDSAENLLGFLLGEQFLSEVRDVGRSTLLLQVQDQVDRRGVGMRSALNRGLSLRNRGEIRRTEGNLAEAVKLFRESLKAFESAAGNPDAPREIARTYDRLGDALLAQGKLTEALPYTEKADEAWNNVANSPGPPDVVRDDCTSTAESLLATVEIKMRMGDADRAHVVMERAYSVLSELMLGRGQSSPRCGPMAEQAAPYPDPNALRALTRAMLARAVLFSSPEDHEGAAALAEQARLLRPSSISARKNALVTLAGRGHVRRRTSPEAALDDDRRVLAEAEELRRSDPDNRLWQRERAVSELLVSTGIVACHQKPGSCTPMPSLDDAEALVLEALAALRALASVDTTNASLQDDLVRAAQARSAILAVQGGHAAERLSIIRDAQRIQAEHDREDAGREQTAVQLLGEESGILLELGRLPEARQTLRQAIDRATKLVAANPDNSLYFDILAFTWGREAALLSRSGDPSGAAAASEEEKRAAAKSQALYRRHVAESDELRARGIAHVTEGSKLLGREAVDYAAVTRELLAAESAFREAALRRPASSGTYDELRKVYDWLQRTEDKLGRKQDRFAALGASMHAAQIAAWLAPESARSAMNNRLLEARNTFAEALIADDDRKNNVAALGLMQEAVVVADSLVQREPGNPDYRFSLASAKCDLGMARRKLGSAGWENAIRSGLIDARKAATLAPDRVLFRTKEASWRQYLGEELAKEKSGT